MIETPIPNHLEYFQRNLYFCTMKITIDKDSGCCFGVVSAISSAEQFLDDNNTLYCLGDIVHNNMELERLAQKGLKYINYDEYCALKDTTVLIRAHGEPPSTYRTALLNNITLIDASCPVVLRLQSSIRKAWDLSCKTNSQVVIFGKKGHAEVVGLLGQTFNKALVVSNEEDVEMIDFSKPVHLFAQTTQSEETYSRIESKIAENMENHSPGFSSQLTVHNTICKLVANRAEQLKTFADAHDVLLFVSDPKSSNGKFLYDICRSANERSYFISSYKDVTPKMLIGASSLGICGATSTPMWLMQEISDCLKKDTGK